MSFLDVPILSISSRKIKKCSNIATKLKEMGILSKIYENTSIVRNNGNIDIEKGCDIKFVCFKNKSQIINIWNTLKKDFDLTCAYLEIPNKYSGCIYNYINPVSCPYVRCS